jgi:hypothetical protein
VLRLHPPKDRNAAFVVDLARGRRSLRRGSAIRL